MFIGGPFSLFGGGAIELVQDKSATSFGINDPANIAAVFDAAPTENNLIVGILNTRVFEPQYSLTVPSGFIQDVQLNTAFATVDTDLVMFHKVAGAAESSTVTFTLGDDNGAGSTLITLHIMEWLGLATSTPGDVVASNDETSGNGLIANTGTTTATAKAVSLAIASCGFGDDDFGAIIDADWSDSYSLEKEFVLGNASVAATIGIASKVLAATGAQNTTLTLDTGGAEQRWSGISIYKGV